MNDANDTRALRDALGAFATGVTVITARDGAGVPAGFTANSFTSVSLDPPLVLFCLGRSAASMPVFARCERFVVNVLAAHQGSVSRLFASRRADKFADLAYDDTLAGGPRISGAVAWFDCDVHDRADGGDHQIIVGRVTAFGASSDEPLAYLRGQYRAFAPLAGAED